MADQYKFWQRRESKNNMKIAKNQKSAAAAAAVIAQLSGGEEAAAAGPRQMKIVVKKEDLKQVLEAIRDRRSILARRGAPPQTAATLEQRLNLMRRRQIMRAAAGQAKARNRSGSWRPVLQSIPEEL